MVNLNARRQKEKRYAVLPNAKKERAFCVCFLYINFSGTGDTPEVFLLARELGTRWSPRAKEGRKRRLQREQRTGF